MIALRGGLEMAYDDVGVGTPVVFLHGFPHSRALWAPQLGALLDHWRCIAPDLRGFGDSAAEPPYSVDQYADDVAELLDSLGLSRAVIAGLSLGGYVAFAFWRRHRARVRALILADTRAAPDTEKARRKRRELIALARDRGSRAVADAQISLTVGASTRAKNPGVVDTVYHMLASASVPGIVGALEAMMARPDSTPTLATIDVPTLVIVGSEDAVVPVDEAESMSDRIAGSQLQVIDGAGHVSNLERPAAFNHVTSEFLAQLTSA
jgi:3-oxoadipate enol-lactonase